MRSGTYHTQQAAGASIHPFATNTVYPELDEPSTTSFAYTFFSNEGTGDSLGAESAPDLVLNDVSNDTVFEQSAISYDEASQAILTVSWKRFDDATGSGPLNGPNDDQPKARREYLAQWFDPIGRSVASANYGTYGGAVLERPESVLERSDTVLVSSSRYGQDGEQVATIDPMDRETRWTNDAMRRRIRLVENVFDEEDDSEGERLTTYSYTADSQLATLTLANDVTGDQVTKT